MRLLFFAPSAYRLGGVQIWLDYLLPGLAARGFDVHLALVDGHLHDAKAYLQMHPFPKVHVLKPKQFTPTSRQKAIAKLVNELSPDAVLGVNIADVYPTGRFFAPEVGQKCRIIATNHALQPDYYEDFKRFAGWLDSVICTNGLSTALCTPLAGMEPERVFYAPYGVPLGANIANRPSEKFTMGYVGRLAREQKEIQDVPAICARAQEMGLELELLVAGSGPQEDEFLSEIERLGIETRFLGHVPHEHLQDKVYSQIDVLLITSSWETGPIVAWEAMSNDVAVVTSEYVGLKAEGSLVDGQNCRTFPCGNIELAAKILCEAGVPEVRAKLISGGRELVRERYTCEASVEQWANVLKRALALPIKKRPVQPSHHFRSGRVEAFFGERLGAMIRKALGRRPEARSPGDEWPHSYSNRRADAEFWERIREVDKIADVGSPQSPPTSRGSALI